MVDRMRRLVPPLVAGLLAIGGCGDEAERESPAMACLDASDGTVTIVAEDLAWDSSCIDGPAGTDIEITVDNRDSGVNHNISFPDAPGEPGTELEAGPVKQVLTVNLPSGEHPFVCDIHPNMVGELRLRGGQG